MDAELPMDVRHAAEGEASDHLEEQGKFSNQVDLALAEPVQELELRRIL